MLTGGKETPRIWVSINASLQQPKWCRITSSIWTLDLRIHTECTRPLICLVTFWNWLLVRLDTSLFCKIRIILLNISLLNMHCDRWDYKHGKNLHIMYRQSTYSLKKNSKHMAWSWLQPSPPPQLTKPECPLGCRDFYFFSHFEV